MTYVLKKIVFWFLRKSISYFEENRFMIWENRFLILEKIVFWFWRKSFLIFSRFIKKRFIKLICLRKNSEKIVCKSRDFNTICSTIVFSLGEYPPRCSIICATVYQYFYYHYITVIVLWKLFWRGVRNSKYLAGLPIDVDNVRKIASRLIWTRMLSSCPRDITYHAFILKSSTNGHKRKRKRSDSVLWQKPLHQQKCQKGKATTQTTPQKSSIKQRLRTDLGRSVGVTTATQLVWLTGLRAHLPTNRNSRLIKRTHV